jgi:hypothetical protein
MQVMSGWEKKKKNLKEIVCLTRPGRIWEDNIKMNFE